MVSQLLARVDPGTEERDAGIDLARDQKLVFVHEAHRGRTLVGESIDPAAGERFHGRGAAPVSDEGQVIESADGSRKPFTALWVLPACPSRGHL
jgi:hypothetical protein